MSSVARPLPTAVSGGEPPRELDAFRENRTYLGADHRRNERRTWIVTGICLVTLVGLLAGGALFRSMALTASGLHMAAHVAALLTAAGAYWLARRMAGDARFAFGAGKVGYLAGFANAVVLAITAVIIAVESVHRLIAPEAVDYGSAIPLAGAGLVVTLLCVWLLRPAHKAEGHHDHDGDLNLSAAHLHLSADAIISVLSIGGLVAGQAFGWSFADPLMGLVGAALVAQFAYTLIRRAGAALLDVNPSPVLTEEIRTRLQASGARVLDLHLWRLGPGHHAAVAVLAADPPQPAETYRARLEGLPGLSHLTIEVRRDGTHACC
ncbi:CDF family Co(II)/Ni(II) efflux transporter DmeF [Phenylobacterium sp. LjRoot219]|uniref:CDF family Co(II)/Ni(II) efflux transporter DmeF n=1 Tax=Phenylobacterium sp. LjRoot219 TaxID=3342283 RepID=UPI003ED0BD34